MNRVDRETLRHVVRLYMERGWQHTAIVEQHLPRRYRPHFNAAEVQAGASHVRAGREAEVVVHHKPSHGILHRHLCHDPCFSLDPVVVT